MSPLVAITSSFFKQILTCLNTMWWKFSQFLSGIFLYIMCHSSNLNCSVKTFSCKFGQNCDFPIANNGTRQGVVLQELHGEKFTKLHNLSPIGPFTALRKLQAAVKTLNVKYTLSFRIPWSKIKTGSSIPDFGYLFLCYHSSYSHCPLIENNINCSLPRAVTHWGISHCRYPSLGMYEAV